MYVPEHHALEVSRNKAFGYDELRQIKATDNSALDSENGLFCYGKSRTDLLLTNKKTRL